MQNKLLPCPFCGGEVSIALCGDDEYSWWIVTRGKNKAKDKNCHCRLFMESGAFYDEDGEVEKEYLIKKWNTRKPMERIVEQLEQQAEQYKRRALELVEKSTEAGIHNKGKSLSYEHAIEIVRNGGKE